MIPSFIKTQIISPDEEVYNGEPEMVVLPGEEGDFAAMFEHAPLITYLRPGKIQVLSKEEDNLVYFVSGGFVKIQDNKCIIMVDYIKKINDIDVKDNENKIVKLLTRIENETDNRQKDNLLSNIDLLKSENEATNEV
jgi:F-type H+-transporting ATPase subunit epsilon